MLLICLYVGPFIYITLRVCVCEGRTVYTLEKNFSSFWGDGTVATEMVSCVVDVFGS